ncbi:MAG: SDR family oxidoreductase [Gammaproteobacteria bacterium]|nr:SDR family oxidoreductase [Gammaproteobacteria bacterium]MDE0368307.1 SDR family oxidoreductase [Gammaproteobacteria bacterium]
MGRLQDKVCLITGAARGQGAVEARLFASEGARVWLTDVRDGEGGAVAEEIGGEYRSLDVRDAGAWEALVAEMLDASKRIDVLVNNAGIFQAKRLIETDLKDFDAVMAVNCTGVFLGMRAVAPAMAEAGRGSIVNISSIAGLGGARSAFAYSASKWAVRGMTKSAAFELGRRGVRVNSIHPGMIETEMLHQVAGYAEDGRMLRAVPLGRVGEADEVARLALFLASDESSYSTGSEFIVDGGITAI